MAAYARLCCIHTWVVLCGCFNMAAWVRLSNKHTLWVFKHDCLGASVLHTHTWVVLCGCFNMAAWVRLRVRLEVPECQRLA